MNSTKGVASAANTGWGRGEIQDGFQSLVLEIHAGYAPEGGVRFEMKLEGVVKVGSVEMGVEDITSMII